LLNLKESTVAEVDGCMKDLLISRALKEIWRLINAANKYIEDSKPWEIAKTGDTERLSAFILTLLRVLEAVMVLIYPFMPSTSEKIASQLGIKEDIFSVGKAVLKKKFIIGIGHLVSKPQPLFPRIK